MSSKVPTGTGPTVTTEADGSFKRKPSAFRNMIEKGGKFKPEGGRYHLYVAYGCPWASRTLIVRKLKGLEDIITITVVSPRQDELGWPFANVDPFPGAGVDPNNKFEHVRDLYFKVDPEYDGRFTVPILWDKKLQAIVNNESSEIIRILNTAFDDLLMPQSASVDLYPASLRPEIDAINELVYDGLNNGVYRAGFATSQPAHDNAVLVVFQTLDRVESILSEPGREYLVGSQLTEADIRLFVTIIRFDVAYFGMFKCNLKDIRTGYPNIHRWLRKLYWNNPAFKDTTDFDHIKTTYYWSKSGNPYSIIPLGPIPDILPLN